ncbi:hypothetical protein HPP92_020356 [Vanilla planifolia]|uniref:TRAPPC10/Trs130 C-terminal domain-containing protein n=1 Tax=Vanilla planifolia TaxID=51239 RepID=A0A835UJS9_VANPL|nr:hypothetical protein HPP92_020356 [Vanilla planifolia]
MSYEKPARPVLKVHKPRPLVDITAAVSSALLINEVQWVGLIVNPLNYSSKFSDWASDIATILWLPVRAIDNSLARGTSFVNPLRHSVVDGMRMIALKLQFGVFHNQIFERTIAVHFTEPFHVTTRVADRCNDGNLLLQDEVLYEVDANPENWMVAGRKRGHVSLAATQGSRVVITVTCLPLVSGYVRPPQLGLPGVSESNVRCNPPGPHLICILPPTLSSSYCVPP